MDELVIDGKTYVSSKRAAQLSGYAKDYIGQMCREGRVESRLVGRSWYVLIEALEEHKKGEVKKDTLEGSPRSEGQKQTVSFPAWEAPKYAAIEPATLPRLSDREKANQSDEAPSARDLRVRDEEHEALVTQMQSAWQEWFTTRTDARDELREEAEVEVAITRDDAEEEQEMDYEKDAFQPETDEDSLVEEEGSVHESVAVTKIQDISPRREVQGTRPARTVSGISSRARFAIQCALIFVSAIAAATALIGTEAVNLSGVRVPVVEFLAGANAIRSN